MPPQNNAYDFITNPQAGAPNKRFGLPTSSNNSIKKRLIIVCGGGFILIILIVIVYSLISNIGKVSVTNLAAVAKFQTELSGIALSASTKVSSQVAKNLAVNTQLTMESAENQYLALLKHDGISLTKTQTTASSSSFNSELSNATNNGEYDTVFVQIIQNQITGYISSLQLAFNNAKVTNQKVLLSNFYQQAKLLGAEATSASQNLS